MRRFELIEGKSSKFWEVEQAERDLNLRWGRIGAAGQSQTKSFDDAAKAQTTLDKLVKEKIGKGYAEVNAPAGEGIGKEPEKVGGASCSPSTTRREQAAPATIKSAETPAAEDAIPATESLDAQVERVFAAVCQAIADETLKPGDSLTVAKIKRQYKVSERGATMAVSRFRSAGFSWWCGGEVAKGAKACALHQIDRAAALVTANAPASPDTPPDPAAPPWAANVVRLSAQMQAAVYASRRFPQPIQEKSLAAAWYEVCREMMLPPCFLHGGTSTRLGIDSSDAVFRPALTRLEARMKAQSAQPEPDSEADTLWLALILSGYSSSDAEMGDALTHYLVAQYGLPQTIDLWLAAQAIQCEREYAASRHVLRLSATVTQSHHYAPLEGAEAALRQYLAQASEAEWRLCADQIKAALPRLHPSRQPTMALLLPDEPELSNRLAETLLALPPNDSSDSLCWLLSTVTDPDVIARLAKKKKDTYSAFWQNTALVATLVQERGTDAVAVLERGAEQEAAGEALAAIGTPEAITALARVASGSKGALSRLSLAADRWPQAAMVALSRFVAAGGKDAGLLTPTLARLLRAHAPEVETVRPWLDVAAQGVIDRQLQRLSGQQEVAETGELPEALAAPPWLAKKQKKAVTTLALAPLALPPVENWPEGARERALSSLNEWEQQHFADAQKSTETLVNDLFPGRNQEYRAQKDAAIAALQPGEKNILQRIGGLLDGGTRAENEGDARAEAFISAWREMKEIRQKELRYFRELIRGLYVPLLPRHIALAFWNTLTGQVETYHLDFLIAHLGIDALPGLIAETRRHPASALPVALNYGAVELAEPMARAYTKMKTLREGGRAWLLKYPEHAACGLIAPALGKPGEARDCAASALRLLAAEGHEALLKEVAARYEQSEVDGVGMALAALLNENPLDRFPAKRQSLPEFWLPRFWSRPVLANGKALPDEALEHLGQMFTFPTHEGVYPGIEQVKAACRPDSLVDFAWDCFNAWLEAGAPAKEGWALTTLGFVGNDDTVRKLTPLIRAWPGEAAHARAVTGLSVLENIGTDVALMLLNGIAQKVKFKGLQDKAREKIAAIAEKRNLTPEELEDRLAPDLGLDEQGTLLLDFGPRRFRVGFDEALKPYVREMDGEGTDARPGARLPDLPKPKKTDDAELSKAAVERFKLLKKDARTIASQQVLRLEVAMCARRRWTPEVFATFLAGHPLVRYLVQRLIWGVYRVGDEGADGGVLQACFRVSEDGAYTTADDEPFDLPADETLCIGVPHALEISAPDAAAFGQIFADYELLQPFAQIGRDTYTLTDTEKSALKLERWKGVEVPTGRVLGLVNKGWRRGEAQDGGSIWYFLKPLYDGNVIELNLAPGIIFGMVDEFPEQTLGAVQFGKKTQWGEISDPKPFTGLDAIAASELIRDMEGLRA
ncbi:MolR family transcriptional regulator [Betaproteobacteria bacterium]|nr:MolR family transcriptional regulator [Betaproteobacteria bacterium]GHU28828.1 MolR family transcriptional regulator [Betaproteobacteria bacterium]